VPKISPNFISNVLILELQNVNKCLSIIVQTDLALKKEMKNKGGGGGIGAKNLN
jgi:hypothetical protein